MKEKSIEEYINEEGKYKAYSLFPFGDNSYTDILDMYNKIKELCTEPSKNIFMPMMKNLIIQCIYMDQIIRQ